jgi:hypothetical protein
VDRPLPHLISQKRIRRNRATRSLSVAQLVIYATMPRQSAIYRFSLPSFGNSQAVHRRQKVNKNKKFFFEKKNQKTFGPLREIVERSVA